MSDDGHVTDVALVIHQVTDLGYCEVHLCSKVVVLVGVASSTKVVLN